MPSSLSPESVSVASWQSDETATKCAICNNNFSLFNRRHHCRKCGRVVCGSCSATNTTYLPATYVVSPPSQIFLESPHVPHRTCDECVEELRMIRSALGSSPRLTGQLPSGVPPLPPPPPNQTLSKVASSGESDVNVCPVCGNRIASDIEQHIVTCLEQNEFSGSPDQNRINRMIVYKLGDKEKSAVPEECSICFEELVPGDKVARLECLCIFHEKCIRSWFTKKGDGCCPVHMIHE